MEPTMDLSAKGQPELEQLGARPEDVITFPEGLVGFPACKRFVILENEALVPLRVLQCVDQREVGFFVIDPRVTDPDYNRSIPDEVWNAVGVLDMSDRLSLVVSVLGDSTEDITANLQAPLLINYKEMKGRQFVLSESSYSMTEPLLLKRSRLPARSAAGGRPS